MPAGPSGERSASDLQREVDALLWYHTIDVAPGVKTRGWWDLRHALPLMPFPDLRGKRCLDIGTWDGFYAFEMERRGAAEVIAVDIADLSEIDFPPDVRAETTFDPAVMSPQPRNEGFHLLHALLESNVKFVTGNIYDLPELGLGRFDFVMLGNVLLHLRDPVRAVDAVRRVTAGKLMLAEQLLVFTHVLTRRRPLFELRGVGRDFQWWVGNDAGLRQLLRVGGFHVEAASKPYLLRPGPHDRGPRPRGIGVGALAKRAAHRALANDAIPGGHLQRAYLAVPRFA